MEPVKRITGIEQLPFVKRYQIVIDLSPIERGAAEDNRHVDAAFVHELQVVAHDKRRFYEEALIPIASALCLPTSAGCRQSVFDT